MDQAGLREKALEEIKQTSWIPAWGETRIEKMVDNRPDWCISRQRTWGVPIALFADKDSGELHPDTQELIEKVAQLVEKQGIQAWFDLKASDLLSEADAARYAKVPDTLDVWFDSGVTHACVVDARDEYTGKHSRPLSGRFGPAPWLVPVIVADIDAMKGHAPYKAALTHGFTVDSQGRKMSKSIGNTVSPQEVVNKLGADILRCGWLLPITPPK